jgi:uncharacterized protein YgiM (DUF1202 family)
MRMNYWLILSLAASLSLQAQVTTTAPPTPPAPGAPAASPEATTPAAAPTTNAPATNAPAAGAEKKKAPKKKADKKSAKKKDAASQLKTVPLVAGQATVIASNVNVRGQAKLNSEVITRLNKGDTVAVLEEVKLKNSGPDEPSAWAKIILPATAHAWVNSSFIDSNKTVVPKKLKLRGGPGENYSVLGMLKKGDQVKEVSAKGEWTQIEAPAEASAYVAAMYLRQEPAGATPTEPTPTPTPVTEPATVAAAPTEPPTVPPPTEPPATATNATAMSTPTATDEPPPPRIVQREGLVRGTVSIQAPTKYELISLENHKAMNYLYTSSPNLDLSRYKGMHILVTGEEGLDERWPNTPVITIQKIQVLE